MPQGVEHKALSNGLGWRWLTAAALTVFAVAFLAPTPVRAGCGDHVVLTPDEPGARANIPSPVQPAKKHAPCTGPNCTRAPIAPPAAPAVPVAPGGQEWACLFTPLQLPAATSAFHSPQERRERPLVLGSGVYHPPR